MSDELPRQIGEEVQPLIGWEPKFSVVYFMSHGCSFLNCLEVVVLVIKQVDGSESAFGWLHFETVLFEFVSNFEE